ncbi:MAG: hypothetical protein M0R70_05340 [Nitrospirae bacterium]|nr:hypothetical protein [Nitrospirota bacterium]
MIIALLIVYACGKSSSSDEVTTSAPTSVKMKADFTASGAPALFKAASVAQLNSCPSDTLPMDGPPYAAGLDCDKDGGSTAYLTPQSFKVAVKRLSFVKANGDHVDFIPDRGLLANSLVYDLTSEVTVSQLTISAGTYASVEAEIYYYEIKMPINSTPTTTQSIRVYLSDDDFSAEGSLGHHQGDITLVDDNGQELGWVGVATAWTTTALQTDKTSVSRPGGTDTETGHQRGLFGNSDLWDQAVFTQGADRDIFLINEPLGLTVSADLTKTVTLIFKVKDSWFWEDFDHDETFNPCENTNDACIDYAEWAPIFNLPVLTIQ